MITISILRAEKSITEVIFCSKRYGNCSCIRPDEHYEGELGTLAIFCTNEYPKHFYTPKSNQKL